MFSLQNYCCFEVYTLPDKLDRVIRIFIVGAEAIMKNVMITDFDIKLTDEDYKTEKAFIEKLESGKKGRLVKTYQRKYEVIQKIILDEPDRGIQLFFKENNKSENTYLELDSIEDYQEVRDFIIGKTCFSDTTEQVGSFMVWAKSVAYAFILACIGIGTYLNGKVT